MVNVVGAALHNKTLPLKSTDLVRMKLDKQHLALTKCHMSFHIDKHSVHSLDSYLHNQVELPFRMLDVDYMLICWNDKNMADLKI
jgi:hypothetical protein